MEDNVALQNVLDYEVDTKLDKAGELNLAYFENRHRVTFSNFPTLSDPNDLRYLNDGYITNADVPSLSIKLHNQIINGKNSYIPIGDRESKSYITNFVGFVDVNAYNYFMMRDYIMMVQEGQTLKNMTNSEWYSQFKIDFIQIDFHDNSPNPKITRTITYQNAFITNLGTLSIDPEKKRAKFNFTVQFEREGKKIVTKI